MFRLVLAGLVVSVIVAISPRHASAEADGCPPDGTGSINFEAADPPEPVSGEPFVHELADGDSRLRTLADYHGRGLLLNFWATWCGPCVREMPALSGLKEQLTRAGVKVEVLTLSQDRGGAPVVRHFFDKEGIGNLDVMIDKRGRLGRKMDVTGLPVTVLIGADGKERGRVLGAAEWDSPEAMKLIRGCIAPDAS